MKMVNILLINIILVSYSFDIFGHFGGVGVLKFRAFLKIDVLTQKWAWAGPFWTFCPTAILYLKFMIFRPGYSRTFEIWKSLTFLKSALETSPKRPKVSKFFWFSIFFLFFFKSSKLLDWILFKNKRGAKSRCLQIFLPEFSHEAYLTILFNSYLSQ